MVFDEIRAAAAAVAARARHVRIDGKRLGGLVVGREVTAGRFTIEEAVAMLGSDVTPSIGPWDRTELAEAASRYAATAGDSAADSARAFVEWLAANNGISG